jgi:hypothetical protein
MQGTPGKHHYSNKHLNMFAKHLQDDTVDCKITPAQIEQLPDEVQEKLVKEQIKLLRASRANKGQ